MGHTNHASTAAGLVMLFGVSMVSVVFVESSGYYPGMLQLKGFDRAQHASLLSTSSSGSSSGSSGASFQDDPTIIYEEGISVDTVLEENRLGISIYSTLAVPFKEYLYAVDSTASQLLKIRLPIDQSSGATVARRIAGDKKGRTGYNDGWGEDALLDHPKGLAIDHDGNVYVADIRNHVIRKISPEGYVTTIAGQPNKTGYADGEGRDALFSSDFTVTYLPRSCSLLISDRGNQRLRMIQLKNPPEKCEYDGMPSYHVWKIVTYLSGVLLTILSAALGIVIYQKAELQRILTDSFGWDDDGKSPFNQHHNGGGSPWPYLGTRPRLTESASIVRRARSLPDDISPDQLHNLMDFSPAHGEEHNRPRKRLGDSAFDISRDGETDDVLSISHSEEGDEASTPQRVRNGSLEDLFADPESMLTGPNDSISGLQSDSARVPPDRRISIDDEISRNFDQFAHNSGS